MKHYRFLWLIPIVLAAVFFVYPIVRGMPNLGDIGGLMFCALLVLLVIFWHSIRRFWRKTIGKILAILIGILFLCGMILGIFFSVPMIKAAQDTYTEPHTLVVLGSRGWGDTPNVMLRSRLDAACDYLTQYPDEKCIVCGGQLLGEALPEAQMMAQYLTDRGIDPTRILLDGTSRDTHENLQNAAAILEEHHLGTDIVLLTSDYHIYRASLYAADAGLSAELWSVTTSPLYLPAFWMREWAGIIQYQFCA